MESLEPVPGGAGWGDPRQDAGYAGAMPRSALPCILISFLEHILSVNINHPYVCFITNTLSNVDCSEKINEI